MKNLFHFDLGKAGKYVYFADGDVPKPWNKENWTKDEEQAQRKEYYEKLDTLNQTHDALKNFETEVLKTLDMPERTFVDKDTLFKRLAEAFGEMEAFNKQKKPSNAPKTFRVLKMLAEQGFNVDKFAVGDKVKIEGGKFTVTRVKDGKTQEVRLTKEEEKKEGEKKEEPKLLEKHETTKVRLYQLVQQLQEKAKAENDTRAVGEPKVYYLTGDIGKVVFPSVPADGLSDADLQKEITEMERGIGLMEEKLKSLESAAPGGGDGPVNPGEGVGAPLIEGEAGEPDPNVDLNPEGGTPAPENQEAAQQKIVEALKKEFDSVGRLINVLGRRDDPNVKIQENNKLVTYRDNILALQKISKRP